MSAKRLSLLGASALLLVQGCLYSRLELDPPVAGTPGGIGGIGPSTSGTQSGSGGSVSTLVGGGGTRPNGDAGSGLGATSGATRGPGGEGGAGGDPVVAGGEGGLGSFGGLGGLGSSGGGSLGGSGGLGGGGGSSEPCADPNQPTLDCPCTSAGALACSGPHQAVQLVCQGGVWTANICTGTDKCDSRTGTCAPVLAACDKQPDNTAFCEAGSPDVRLVCGPDWVSTTRELCGGICQGGICLNPKCGDGKLDGVEACDDGNLNPVDGCEIDCKKSAVEELALGSLHSCARLVGGYVRCWGDNTDNKLGTGTAVLYAEKQPYQIPYPTGGVDLGGEAKQIVAGYYHTCALLNDGTVRCWGQNTVGQLGYGNLTAVTTTPSKAGAISLGGKVSAIAAGGFNTCAIMADTKQLRCWGSNAEGELGLGLGYDTSGNPISPSDTKVPSATAVVPVGKVNAVAVGAFHICALLESGAVRCWGNSSDGQLGLGPASPSPDAPYVGDDEQPTVNVKFPGTAKATTLSAGTNHTCVLLDTGNPLCWGSNQHGQLGRGNINPVGDNETPEADGQPFIDGTVVSIKAGGWITCAQTQGTKTGYRCWGRNTKGQLGLAHITNWGTRDLNPSQLPSDLSPIAFPSGISVSSIAMGFQHTCAVLSTGEARCWGHNNLNQLGRIAASASPDYVGGDAALLPGLLPSSKVFP